MKNQFIKFKNNEKSRRKIIVIYYTNDAKNTIFGVIVHEIRCSVQR